MDLKKGGAMFFLRKKINNKEKNDFQKNIVDDIERIRLNIEFTSVEKDIKSILIIPSDIKSYDPRFIKYLAYSWKKTEKRILVIDINFRSSKIIKNFKSKSDFILTDILNDENSIDKFILETNRQKIVTIQGGQNILSPADLFSSDIFLKFLAKVKQRYDMVIIDVPPIENNSEAVIIGRYVDSAIIVSKYGESKQKTVEDSIKLLKHNNVTLLGAVVLS